MTAYAVFDGHNDLLNCLWAEDDREGAGFFAGRAGHLDLAKCRAGGFAGGFFAIWVPGDPALDPPKMAVERVFPPIGVDRARAATLEMAAILIRMARARPDAIRLCTSAAEIEAARAAGAIAALMHIEGCEGIGPDLDELQLYHAAGLRSLGPVWSRSNIFGHGVPFNFPASPDTGPGLTEAGKRLVRECDRLRLVLDLSHLNEAGFWDVARLSQAPLVATHSNAHAVTAATRNLTDRQLDAIAERRGIVGLNFGVQFLRPDGMKNPDTGPEDLIRHLDHLLARLGEGGVALGSDFDGAMMPDFLGSAQRLPVLVGAMERAGYGEALIRRILWGNWLDLLGRVIG
ncbi:MAG TPA: membrane dipeptidase [Paracoccaceae bacterium]